MTKRWYHYGMISFPAQLLIMVGCLLTFFASLMFYDVMEEDIVHFEGECEIEQYVNDEGETTLDMIAQCDEHRVGLTSEQERLVYHQELTTGERPAIMCKYTISEYLKDERWNCKVQTSEESNV